MPRTAKSPVVKTEDMLIGALLRVPAQAIQRRLIKELNNAGFEVPEAGAIEVFGFQVEAQPCASAYKKTGARNGVYSSARFGEDTLRVVTDGPDQHRFQIRITAKD